MELSTAQQILVVLLSITLAVLLILAIVAAVLVIKILKTLRMVTEKAEKVIESAEAVGTVIKNATTPVGLFHFARSVFDMITSKQKNNKEQ